MKTNKFSNYESSTMYVYVFNAGVYAYTRVYIFVCTRAPCMFLRSHIWPIRAREYTRIFMRIHTCKLLRVRNYVWFVHSIYTCCAPSACRECNILTLE